MRPVRTILAQQPRVVSIITVILLLWVTTGMTMQYSPAGEIYGESDSQEQSGPVSGPVKDTEDSPSTTTTLSSFQEAVIPISKIQILFICNFFREWCLVELDDSFIINDVPLPSSEFFLTLFRQIISPNAP